MKEKLEKSNVQEIFELSMVQKGMLFFYLKESSENLYNVQLSFIIEGRLNVNTLKEAFLVVQSNNDVLRSVFRWEEVSKPIQIILKDCPVNFAYHDVSQNLNHVASDMVQKYTIDERNKRFDLTQLPFLITVIKTSDESFTLNITHHHILYDGWSTGILLKELFTQYSKLADNKKPDIIEKPSYKEIQHAIKKNEQSVNANLYWKNYLSEHEIISFFSKRQLEANENEQVCKVLIKASNAKLDEFSKEYRVTKAAIIYAAYGMLLQKYNDSADIVFGTTVSNREVSIQGNDKIVGNFINTIPLRLKDNDERSLLDVVTEVNQDLITRSQFNNSSYFEIKRLVDLKPTEELFDSVVIIENYPLDNKLINCNKDFEIKLNSVYENTGIPLVVTVFFKEELEIELAYRTSFISETFAKTLANQFTALIGEILESRHKKVKSISLLSENERHQLLHEFNDTEVGYPKVKTLVNLFEEQVALTPNKVALVFNDQELTYNQLNEKANLLAASLREKGIQPNQVVALHTSRSLEMYICILAVLKSGGCYLPLDPTFPKERLEYMLSDTRASILLTTSDLRDAEFNVDYSLDIIVVNEDVLSGKTGNLMPVNKSDDLAYVIYTSGSTGRPKGVMLSHRAVHNYIISMVKAVPFSWGMTIVSVTTFSFDIFVTESLLPLTQGIKIVIADEATQKDPALLRKLIATRDIKMIQTTPSRYKALTDDLEAFKVGAKNVECFLVGGEAFPEDLLKKLKANSKARIINVYGPTETTVWSASIDLTNAEKVSIGKPIGNTQLYVLNKHMQLQPMGVGGDLYIGGDGLAQGYWNNQELTDKAFVQNPFSSEGKIYKTGDKARWLDNGTLEYLGRNDAQVKIRGYRIETGEIESQMVKHDSIKECVVLAKERNGSNQLVAYYLEKEKSGVEPDDLRSFLAQSLPEYMVPAYYIPLKSLPLTLNGKLDKKLLPEPTLAVEKNFVGAQGDAEKAIFKIWSEVLGNDKISTHQNFFDIGGDSLKLISVSTKIKKALGRDVLVTDLFNHPTISSLAKFLSPEDKQEVAADSAPSVEAIDTTSSDIAIIGMACRFPEATNIDEFWKNLHAGKESIKREERNTNDSLIYAKGFLADYDSFDASFFNYVPSEASSMDPQIRLFHECTWEALENAGYNPNTYSELIGLYGGASVNPYYNVNIDKDDNDDWVEKWEAITYADKDFLCPRVSYKLNLKGPSVNITTACSTSLVAVDTACNELLANKCSIAIAGGVSISLHDNDGYTHRKGMILSSDGRCRAFDENSSGTVSGNGVGIVVLKKLQDALRDGDVIHAVIKGTATNNDGNEKIGFTAPSIEGQAKVIARAIKNAGIQAESVSYVEAHGTGTILGDPIEIAGLTKAFNTSFKQFCAIGSIKTNIGHLDAAAGIAGLIKTVLALKNKQLPPSLHFSKPNQNINFENSPFYVNASLKNWEGGKYPRRAGVSSFGIGGTNAHVILEESPEQKSSSASRDFQVLVLSGKTQSSLNNNIIRIREHLCSQSEIKLSDIAYTLQLGREHFAYRKKLVCASKEEAIELLTDAIDESSDPINTDQKNPIVFMFSGQGSQYANMCADLYDKEALFKETVNSCFDVVRQIAGYDLAPILFAKDESGNQTPLHNTEFTQPCLFIVEYALTKLLMKWGVKPTLMIGHSIGEYVAACLSGVFSLEDALKLVVKRGVIMQKTPKGSMLSISIQQDALSPFLKDNNDISLAAINSTELCVVSGTDEEITLFKNKIERAGYASKLIRTSHAFHSYMMDGILKEFEEVVASVKMNPLQIPFVSNLTGKNATDSQVSTAAYWVNHLRHSVKFADGIEAILENEAAIFIEIGPGNALSTFVRSNHKRTEKSKVVNLVRHPKQKGDDLKYLLSGIGELWASGVKINWASYYEVEKRNRVSLPSYAFEKTKFPVKFNFSGKVEGKNVLSRNANIAEWFYVPSWKSVPIIPITDSANPGSSYLLFADDAGLSNLLADKFSSENRVFTVVKKGKEFLAKKDNWYELNPKRKEDFSKLFRSLSEKKGKIDNIIYAWPITKNSKQDNQDFYSLIHLIKSAYESKYLQNTHITLVTANIQNVLGNEKLSADLAPLLGLMKVIPQEYPNVSTSHIDVCHSEFENARFIKLLYNEIKGKESGLVMALRNLKKWKQHFERINGLRQEQVKNIRQNGVYLITGGLGKLGFNLAKYLLKRYQAKVILLGRSEFSEEAQITHSNEGETTKEFSTKLERIKELKKEGDVLYIKCDISKNDELIKAIQQGESKFGTINGVIHAAGAVRGKSIDLISRLTKEGYEIQFKTKVKGLYNLCNTLGTKELDFCLIASSISSFLGGIRFGAYASANVAVDYHFNFLRECNQLNTWISVNFDGLAFDDHNGDGIKTIELYDVFEQLISFKDIPQVIVSVADLEQRIAEWVVKKDAENINSQKTSIAGNVSYDSSISTSIEVERQLVEMWRDYFGISDIRLTDDFFELGGDSLKVLTMIGRIHKKFNIELSIAEFFEQSTIKQLSNFLAKKNSESKITGEEFTLIPRAKKKSHYALSSVQRRLYFLYQFDSSSVAYNMPLALSLTGKLDLARLNETFSKLIARHESLRTCFEIIDGQPYQKVTEQFELHIERYQALGNQDQLIKDFIKPFDLSIAPLIRVGVINISAEEHILLVDMHHIITDGVSKSVLIQDFKALYSDQELPELQIHYKDYAEWQCAKDLQKEIGKRREFWVNEFSDNVAVLDLPTDFPRPAIKSYEGDTLHFKISKEDTAKLKALAENENATLFTILLSAYTILLNKLSGQDDVVVGTPISGRQHQDLERMMGIFINTLLIRSHPKGRISFKEFLAQVKSKVLVSFDHQAYPYEVLIDELGVERNTSRNPLFDAFFSFENFERSALELPGLIIKPYHDGHVVSKFDITLTAREELGLISLYFEYSSKLFKRETIERFVSYFQRIVSTIIADEETKLSAIEIISAEEKQQILKQFNNTQTPFAKDDTIHGIFEQRVLESGDSVAILFAGESITYETLNKRSNQVARSIQRMGVNQESVLGILLPRSEEMLVSIIGVLKAGCAYIPIDPEYPTDRIKYIVEDSGLSLLLTNATLQQTASSYGFGRATLDVTSEEVLSEEITNLTLNVSSSQLAYMIYTSGSTGHPKGVMIEHRNVINFIKGITKRIDMSKAHTMLCLTTISFDIFVLESILPLLKGMRIVLASSADQKAATALGDLIKERNVDLVQITPSHLKLLLSAGQGEAVLRGVKVLMVGGEAFPAELLKTVQKSYRGKIYNMYGPTETTVWSTIQDLTTATSIDIGTPIANTSIRIIDSHQNLQPIGIAGELCIGGEGVGRGYWKKEALTQEKFIGDSAGGEGKVYRTGDLARWLSNGSIEYLGRIDNQVKIRGYRIELGEIENQLTRIVSIQEAVVYTKEKEGDKFLIAYYVSNEEQATSQLRSHLSENLPEYMVPSYFVHLEKLPLTPNGKIDRRSLPDPEITAGDTYQAPSNEIEEKLVAIWSDVLKLDKEVISVNRSFFEMGGNSLKAAFMVNKIFKELRVQIPLQDFFIANSVLKMSEYIENETWIREEAQREVTQGDEFYIE